MRKDQEVFLVRPLHLEYSLFWNPKLESVWIRILFLSSWQTRVLRGLSWPRHSDGHHVERSRSDGRGPAAHRWVSGQRDKLWLVSVFHWELTRVCLVPFCPSSWERVLSSASDVRTSGRHRDHEAEAHPDPPEQDRSGEGEPGQGAVRADPGLCAGWVQTGSAGFLCKVK